jgi:dephospho-CoA kinase
MLKVGLTGGLASGKSTVGQLLLAHGCHLLEADKIGHHLLDLTGPAYAPVLAAFGPGILASNQSIDRKKLGAVVFAEPAELEKLNKIIHPLVFQEQERWFHQIAQRDLHAIAIVEAAIMIEIGSYRRYDKLILVHCSEAQQIARAMARDGLAEAAIRQRLARQLPLEEKKRYAHFLIDTSGAPENTRRQVADVFAALQETARATPAPKETK